jgi:hypothetical protein
MRKATLTFVAAFVALTLLAGYAIVATDSDQPAHESAEFVMTLEQLKALNPAVTAHYAQVSPCVPHMGVHYAAVVDGRPAMAPSVVLAVDPVNGQLTAMEIIVPADQPWQPWYDQPEGEPYELAPGMKFWTQHVYLVDHTSINECPPMDE